MRALWLVFIFNVVQHRWSAQAGYVWRSEIKVEDYPFRNVSLSWDERVEDIVSRLTLEEMQLQMARGGAGNIGGPAPAIPRLGIGPYEWDTECLRGDVTAPGYATQFPQSIGLGAAFDTDLIFRVAEATAVEVRGKHNDFVKQGNYGFHTGASCFSPVINIMRDPRWGRNQETYGEDPYLTGLYSDSFIRGLQGNDPRYVRASGGCKHFDAYAGPENIPVTRFVFSANVSEEDWRMTFLPAFRMCVKAGTYNLMCSYNSINGIPACANKKLLTDIARGEWGFKGYVISDQGAIENVIGSHKYRNNSVDTVAACVNAGCNLELSSNKADPVYFSLVDAVKQGKVTEEKVRESVRPLFYTRMRLGEFDPPEMNQYSKLSNADVETQEHKLLAVEAAMKSFVLLKNLNNFLPLDQTKKFNTVSVVGSFGNSTHITGDYPPNAPPEDISTVAESLGSLGSKLQYAQGCDQEKDRCVNYDSQSVINAVQNTDIIFVALGTGQKGESEGNDRSDTELPGYQKQLLLDVIKNSNSKPIVLLLFNAGPLNISFADQDDSVSAILECFFPAQATGEAIRHTLLNDVAGAPPAARLPFTWPLLASQIPDMTNYSMKGRTYRYLDSNPLYPFGYGLSYSTFTYTTLTKPGTVKAGEPLYGAVRLQNNGPIDADEVIQIYIGWNNASLPAPKLQLAAFARQRVPSKQSVTYAFEIDAERMALWMNGGWYVTPGEMSIYVGGQQPNQVKSLSSNVLSSTFTITGSSPVYLGRY